MRFEGTIGTAGVVPLPGDLIDIDVSSIRAAVELQPAV
jgi:hypothetical protein